MRNYREPGYYKVIYKGEKYIAEYNGLVWYLPGYETSFECDCFDWVDDCENKIDF